MWYALFKGTLLDKVQKLILDRAHLNVRTDWVSQVGSMEPTLYLNSLFVGSKNRVQLAEHDQQVSPLPGNYWKGLIQALAMLSCKRPKRIFLTHKASHVICLACSQSRNKGTHRFGDMRPANCVQYGPTASLPEAGPKKTSLVCIISCSAGCQGQGLVFSWFPRRFDHG